MHYEFDALIKIRSGQRLISAKVELDKDDLKNGVVTLENLNLVLLPAKLVFFIMIIKE